MTTIPTIEELRAMPRADADRKLVDLSIEFARESLEGINDETTIDAEQRLEQVSVLRRELRTNA